MKRADPGGSEDLSQRLRDLPAVDLIARSLDPNVPHDVRVGIARRAIDEARDRIRSGEGARSNQEVLTRAQELLIASDRSLLQPVINATGVLIHTNLGRVPLGPEQVDAVAAIARGYSNLEFDLNTGRRGNRYAHTRSLIRSITGAESALVVNNNAAAVLVVLAALCSGREVIVSRGELIEIGGEFRVPDVMTASGASLVEVGTTNRTHLADYERAISSQTAAILKVHPSNYRLVGFTATVEATELTKLSRGRGVMFLHDLGSGLVKRLPGWNDADPTVRATVAEGADIVTFSGDKLLGGPQAGLIAGRESLIDPISKHPLMRAVRVDKMTLAALEATLAAYVRGEPDTLPLWKMATLPLRDVEARARALAPVTASLSGSIEVARCFSVMGGGSLPGAEIESWGVALSHPSRSSDEIERSLRRSLPPIIARIEDERVVLDLRTVPDACDEHLASSIARVLA